MSERPQISPNILAEIAESAPDRLRRKLDKKPTAANEWDWSQAGSTWTIDAGNETVRLDSQENIISRVEQVACSCLLSPRCFHVLSVLSVLELANAVSEESPSQEELQHDSEPLASDTLTTDQIAAAESLWKAAAAILASGARAAGTLLQSHLLRAIHECRSLGLHRLAAGGLRVMQNIRQLREEHDAFRSEDLLTDLTELLRVAWMLAHSQALPTREWLGVARRVFVAAGSLRLTGLFSEPILTRSGYSGVVTYLLADDDTIFSVSNVRPGSSERIAEAYQTGADLGGLSIPHQTLNRQTLLVQKATRSADGRLGSGKDCRAVTTESLGWATEAVARRFERPVMEQINRVFELVDLPTTDQPAGWDLLFLRGTLLGKLRDQLILNLPGEVGVIGLKIANDHPALPFRDNLEKLSEGAGMEIFCIARMLLSNPGEALLLAFGPIPDDNTPAICHLPETWKRKANFGIDKLERRFFVKQKVPRSGMHFAGESETASDGLDFLRRRLQAVALGGRHALPTGRIKSTVTDAGRLDSNLQPAAASLIKALAQCASKNQTDLLGIRFPPDPTQLARMWLAGAVYEETARRHFQRWNWTKAEN